MNSKKLLYLNEAAECLKVLAHPIRLRILTLLRDSPGMSVSEIADTCECLQHVTSEHLRLMNRCGFLTFSKEGRLTKYSISEDHIYNILECIENKFKNTKR